MGFQQKTALLSILFVAMVLPLLADETNGLCLISSKQKADIKVFNADIYSQNNANTDFGVNLGTSPYKRGLDGYGMLNPVALRISGHAYPCTGWGYTGWSGPPAGSNYTMWFDVRNQNDAEVAAKLYSATCHLRSPPGYKFLAQFAPSNRTFHTNEPVTVEFTLKNLDQRTMTFQPEWQRHYQYSFLGMLNQQLVPGLNETKDANAVFIDGSIDIPKLISIDPGKSFNDQLDLKEWFAFDKPGNYIVHGFYHLNFYPANCSNASPESEIWDEYASADFSIVVK